MSEPISCCRPIAMMFLVLLRLAIGWHLLYEGLHKLESQRTGRPWSAAAYLHNSTGPFAEHFRRLAGESGEHGLILDPSTLQSQWSQYLSRFREFYALTAPQREQAEQALAELAGAMREEFFDDGQIRGTIQQYLADRANQRDEEFQTTSEQSRLQGNERLLREKVADWTGRFENRLNEMLTADQRAQGAVRGPMRQMDKINAAVIWGQVVGGGCLLLGLFSRLSAFWSAVMLILFYLSMPPFPGLAAAETGTGHYLYVNENLIEALALLVLATTGSGRWGGLDALVRAVITRPLFGVGRPKPE